MTDKLPLIYLRAIEPEDLDTLYSIENDTNVWNVSTTNVPYSRYVLYDYIANAKNDIYADRQVRMMIEDEKHDVVGIVDIINFDPKNMRAEIGIVIIQKYRNKGYALATLKKINSYAQNILHLHQLYVYVNKDNKKSISVFEKSGFVQSNELKDWLFDGKKYHNALLMQLFL